jgi:hypothetical protein|tara:strand:+ start:849 stop:1076 length:228 start_codon:yes stop_codon:yes gene_type:complete
MQTIYEKTLVLTNTRNEQSIEVEVDNVRENQSLEVYVAANKIKMIWNGKTYVGNKGGMEFTTPGPKSRTIREGRY